MKRLAALVAVAIALVACESVQAKLSMGPPPGAPAFLKDLPDEVRSGLPVNFTQEKAGTFAVPNTLVSLMGKRITTVDDWLGTRRPELRQMLIDNQYGVPLSVAYPRKPSIGRDYSERGVPALGGAAKRTQSTIHLTTDRGAHDIDVLLYTPVSAKGPVPVVLMLNFSPSVVMVDEAGIKAVDGWANGERIPGAQARPIAKPDVLSFVTHGYGVAMVYYGQIEPDFAGGAALGMRKIYAPVDEAKRKPNEIGAIGVWAEGVSIVRDHLAMDPTVDGDRIALYGISRLGKAVLWAAANDPKFAAVVAVCSGEGGAALSRRKYGETIAHVSEAFPYWFAPTWKDYAPDPNVSPVDAHMTLAMIAPRPLMLITGETDAWSDPYGEFLSARLATPVWRLFGKEGVDGYPALDAPTRGDLVFMTHTGGHGPMPQDTPAILSFLDRHLRR